MTNKLNILVFGNSYWVGYEPIKQTFNNQHPMRLRGNNTYVFQEITEFLENNFDIVSNNIKHETIDDCNMILNVALKHTLTLDNIKEIPCKFYITADNNMLTLCLHCQPFKG